MPRGLSEPTDGANESIVQSGTTRAVASVLLGTELKLLDATRARIAHAYADAPSDSGLEHELGEGLTVVRKACKRVREAWAELAQYEPPMEKPKPLRAVGPLN